MTPRPPARARRRGLWALALLACAVWAAALARDGFDAWIDATELPPLAVATSVEVLAADGSLLRAFTVEDGRWRLAVQPGGVDPGYLALLIAYEDRRFFSHAGVDPWAMVRALWQAIWHGRPVSGASTLTMQVARLLENSGTGRWEGKIRQIRLALALERRLSKDQILALYLHLAPFGGNLEGVRAASLAYFGREPARLTPAQSALLVALPQSPELRRPDRFPERAQEARDRVLDRMLRDGLVDADLVAAARSEPVPDRRRPFPALAPHLAERLRAEDPARVVHRTHIDPALQAALEALAAQSVAGGDPHLSVAIIVADHRTGAVRASVGSPGHTDDARLGWVDMTRALRSPGSTLKPLVYALAFDDGIAHPETLIEDRPRAFGAYAPQNFDRRFRGTVTLREALQLSLNLPVVELAAAIGPARLMAALRRAGVEAVLPDREAPGLAVALGGVGVSLEGLVQLYAVLANGGAVQPLTLRADGVDRAGAGSGARLVGRGAAWMVGDVLAGALPPPGWAAARSVAWKTGTSYGHRDALAIGYDGRHVVGVWMGRADGTPVPGVFGAALAGPVLFQAFQRLGPSPAPLPPPPPEVLTLTNSALPPPLRRFSGGPDAPVGGGPAPVIAFPPDGAEVELLAGHLHARVEGGSPPFTWLVDGVPLVGSSADRRAALPMMEAGFVTLSVIDAEGRATRARLRLH